MKLIDLEEGKKSVKADKRKKAKAKNAPEIVVRMPDGDYFKFSVTYAFKGKNWTFELWAKSRKEAEHRLHNIKHHPCEMNMILAERPL